MGFTFRGGVHLGMAMRGHETDMKMNTTRTGFTFRGGVHLEMAMCGHETDMKINTTPSATAIQEMKEEWRNGISTE